MDMAGLIYIFGSVHICYIPCICLRVYRAILSCCVRKCNTKLSRKFHHTCTRDMHTLIFIVIEDLNTSHISKRFLKSVIREQIHALLSFNMRCIQSVALHFLTIKRIVLYPIFPPHSAAQNKMALCNVFTYSYKVNFALATHTHIPLLCARYEGFYYNEGVIFKVRIRLLVIRCLHFETDTASLLNHI